MKKINDWLAVHFTLAFGTMWTTYLFIVYGFFPLIWPAYYDKFLYWSNTVQLWSLPLLMVGTNLLGKSGERRNKETYDFVKSELETVKQNHALAKGMYVVLARQNSQILAKLDKLEGKRKEKAPVLTPGP